MFLCACLLLAGHRLSGQAVVFSVQAPPPPPPPPAPASAGSAAGALKVVPPPPMDIPPEKLPQFEVSSVKKPEGRQTVSTIRTPGGGRITVVNLPLRTILMQAWAPMREYQLSGAPGWMTSDRFNITAKAETNAPRDQLMLMLRALLVERFQLKYHVEKREMQAYVLTTAEEVWKPTARMKPVDCTAGRGAPPPSGGPIRPEQMPCGGLTSLSTGGITARGMTIANFVSLLSSLGGLGVIHDRTGLTGTYTIELDMSPTSLLRSLNASLLLSGVSAAGGADLLPQVAEGRSLDSAIGDLGLKLSRQKEMVEVLVIDSVSQPDED